MKYVRKLFLDCLLPPLPFAELVIDDGGEFECSFSKCCCNSTGSTNPFIHIGQINPSACASPEALSPDALFPTTRTGEEKSCA